MDTNELIAILNSLPETRLRLFQLAGKVLGEDGRIDPEKVAFHYKEITEALEEAKAYSNSTREALRCLIEMDRSQS